MDKKIKVVVLVAYEEASVGQDLVKIDQSERRRVDPERIAIEAEARIAFLRSRPLSKPAKRERLLIWELDQLAERARAALAAERDGAVSETAAAEERGKLDKLAFAAFERFTALLDALDEDYPTRAAPQSPSRRAEELAAIERFLAARAAVHSTTGTEGK